jgi:hypothetical protein
MRLTDADLVPSEFRDARLACDRSHNRAGTIALLSVSNLSVLTDLVKPSIGT